jgi:ABC-type nickel/cobalt efflux system permease component RcnA
MQHRESQKLGYHGRGVGSRAQGVIAKTLAVVAAGLLIASAIAVSLVLFVIALSGLLVFGLYLWWKTRELRKQMRSRPGQGDVIEGEVIREVHLKDAERD